MKDKGHGEILKEIKPEVEVGDNLGGVGGGENMIKIYCIMFSKNKQKHLGQVLVVNSFYPSTCEAEAGGSL